MCIRDRERIVENGIEVTGVVELRALYVVSDDEMPFYAAETALPFRHTIEVPGIGPDCRYELQSSIDQLSTTCLLYTSYTEAEKVFNAIEIGDPVIVYYSLDDVTGPQPTQKNSL